MMTSGMTSGAVIMPSISVLPRKRRNLHQRHGGEGAEDKGNRGADGGDLQAEHGGADQLVVAA